MSKRKRANDRSLPTLICLVIVLCARLWPASVMAQTTENLVSSHLFEFDLTEPEKNRIDRRPEVIIDRELSDVYKPQIRMSFWKGEAKFKLSLIESKNSNPSSSNFRLIDQSAVPKLIYEISESSYHKLYKRIDNCFEWEIILKKKPTENVFSYQFETDRLTFYYQDSVNTDNIYFEQPDSVRYSYAVYHSAKRNNRLTVNGHDTTFYNYGTGKAFHLYRPRIWDSGGDTTWGAIAIDTVAKLLSVSVPSNFLDMAIYPVTIDPTFGYTSAGASFSNPGNLSLQVNYTDEVTTGSAILDSGFIHAKKQIALGNPVVKVSCYKKSGTFSTDSLIASSTQFEITSTTFAWYKAAITGSLLATLDYVASFHADDGFGGSLLKFSYDFADSSSVKVTGLSDMTAPSTLSGATYNNLRYSCYITYVVNQDDPSYRRRKIQLSKEVK